MGNTTRCLIGAEWLCTPQIPWTRLYTFSQVERNDAGVHTWGAIQKSHEGVTLHMFQIETQIANHDEVRQLQGYA